jgi:glycosyltransferase involved in cell wall biosynthesis
MRIAVSLLNFRPGRIGGTESYLRQLIRHLPKVGREEEIIFIAQRDLARELTPLGVALAGVNAPLQAINGMRVLEAVSAFRALPIEAVVRQLAPDVVLFPQQVMFPKHVDCPAVVVAHDLYHVFLPKNLGIAQRFYRGCIYEWSIRRAERVIAVSDYTRRSLVEHYELHDVADRIHTVHHGTEMGTKEDRLALAPEAAPPYLYYPAVSHPHKNHLELFRTLARLRRRGECPYRLVLTGLKTRYWARLARELRNLGMTDWVSHLGHVSYERVRAAYQGAAAVVFPSAFEGFGIPVVEAVSFGKKVITSDLEVFREIGVPDGLRIDFTRPEELLRALNQPGPTVLTRPVQSWRETARQTLDVARMAAPDCVKFVGVHRRGWSAGSVRYSAKAA